MALEKICLFTVLTIGLSRNYINFPLFKLERVFYNIYVLRQLRKIKGDIHMTDNLLNSMERINVVAEVLYDLLSDNPRAQVLTEIIIEASQTKQQ